MLEEMGLLAEFWELLCDGSWELPFAQDKSVYRKLTLEVLTSFTIA